jgi:hypothetical protein
MNKVVIFQKLIAIEKIGGFAELQNLIQKLPDELQKQPSISLQIIRILLNQGEFNLAAAVLEKIDLTQAETGEKIIAELLKLQIGVFRNEIFARIAGEKTDQLLKVIFEKKLAISEQARAVQITAQIFLIGCLYSEFPPEKKSEARNLLKEAIEKLEKSELFEQSFSLRLSYSDSLDDVNQKLDELLKISEKALDSGDLANAGKAFCSQAQIMLQNGFPNDDIYKLLEKAEKNFTESKHAHGNIETLHIRAKLQIEREQAPPKILLPIIEQYQSAGYISGKLSALMDIIHVFHENGDLNSASSYQQKLIESVKTSGFLMFLFNHNLQIADVLIRNGNFSKAIEVCEETLAIKNIPQMQIAAYSQLLGNAYFSIRNFEKSDSYYAIARQTFENINQIESASNISILQVNNLDELREDKAWDKGEEILTTEIVKPANRENTELTIRFYEQLAQIKLNRFSYSPTKRFDSLLLSEAEAQIIKAETLLSKLPARRSALRKGSLLQIRGQLGFNRGNNAEIVKYWNEAAEVFDSAGFEFEAANSQYLIGLVFHNLANQKVLPNALISQEALLKAINYYDKNAMRIQAADAHYHLAHLYNNTMAILSFSSESSDELIPQTLTHIKKAEENFDSVRRDFYTSNAVDAQLGKQAIIEKSFRLYQLGLELYLLKNGDKAATWNWMQRAKSRGLTDLLAGSFIQPEKLISEIRQNSDALKAVKKEQELRLRLRNVSADKVSVLRDELIELQKSMVSEPVLKNYLDIRTGNPVKVSNLERISAEECELEKSCVFIDWINIGKTLYLVCFRSGFEPAFIPLEIELREVEEFYRTWLGDESFWSTLSEDYEFLNKLNPLIEPLGELTKPEELLVFAPTGILFSLPLHALKIGEEFLIDRNPVIYEPSLSILNQCYARRRESTDKRSFAVFGDPNMDRAAAFEAANYLAEKYKAELLTGNDVTIDSFVLKAKEKDVIHFQGHAVFNAEAPVKSYLKFADGKLYVGDIFSKLNLDAEIISLMACESGVNRINTGDELLGLIPALIYAGGRSVLSTLWRVNEDAASEMAKLFYSELYNSRERIDKARALRRAILSLKENEKFSVPYHWAGYILYGDWY